MYIMVPNDDGLFKQDTAFFWKSSNKKITAVRSLKRNSRKTCLESCLGAVTFLPYKPWQEDEWDPVVQEDKDLADVTLTSEDGQQV